jgi:hypothetical protein
MRQGDLGSLSPADSADNQRQCDKAQGAPERRLQPARFLVVLGPDTSPLNRALLSLK